MSDRPGRRARANRGPVTLIGQFLLAYALDDRERMHQLKAILSRTGWHHSNSVIIAAVHEAVSLRWPGSYASKDVSQAVLQAVAMAPRREKVDAATAEALVREALGERVELPADEPSQVAHRLYVLWAFARQMGMSVPDIAALLERAEKLAFDSGYSPTRAE